MLALIHRISDYHTIEVIHMTLCHRNNIVTTFINNYSVNNAILSKRCIKLAIFFAAPNTPVDANMLCTCHYETTIIIALGCGLSILFVLLIVVTMIAIKFYILFIGSKKKPQRESDVYYDTINTAHPPPIIDTELNIAYGHPKKLK